VAYDFHKSYKLPEWLVEELIPSEAMNDFLGQSGTGKSWFVEWLAVCIVYDHDFLGLKVTPHNVLFIDEETTEDRLHERLKAFSNYMEEKGYEKKRDLYLEPSKGYRLSDGSLIKRIERSKAKVVIIDSLGHVAGSLNENSTQDMAILSELKKAVVGKGKTIILVHHVSEHADVSIDEIMTTDNPNRLTFGNSMINQTADSLYYFASKHQSDLTNLYVRPVPKRVSLAVKPFIAQLRKKEKVVHGRRTMLSSHFVMTGLYRNNKPMFEVDRDILRLFEQEPKRRKVYQVVLDIGDKYTKKMVRTSLSRLVKSGKLVEHKVSPKLFTYELAE
jgi:RecA-family ATPase